MVRMTLHASPIQPSVASSQLSVSSFQFPVSSGRAPFVTKRGSEVRTVHAFASYRSSMPFAITLLAALLFQSIDDITGAWRGSVIHEGETREVIVEFVRKGDKVVTLFSTPSLDVWKMPYALAERSGNRVTAGSAVFEFDPSTATLTTTLPPEMVPKYPLRVTLRRADPVVPTERPPIDAPAREPKWTLDLGAPIWAAIAADGDTVFAGADDGRLHAIDAASGRERWTFTAGGAIRARPAFLASDVIVQADDGMLYRIDGRRGTGKWRVRIARARTRLALNDPASRYEKFAVYGSQSLRLPPEGGSYRILKGNREPRTLRTANSELRTNCKLLTANDCKLQTANPCEPRTPNCQRPQTADRKLQALRTANSPRAWVSAPCSS
jgi:hypothetical protein